MNKTLNSRRSPPETEVSLESLLKMNEMNEEINILQRKKIEMLQKKKMNQLLGDVNNVQEDVNNFQKEEANKLYKEKLRDKFYKKEVDYLQEDINDFLQVEKLDYPQEDISEFLHEQAEQLKSKIGKEEPKTVIKEKKSKLYLKSS
ncbi:hypothetical protein M758_10G155800 [Ceratodon purpureus]|nr:hypothetical protein M758_10G155800 [Ceratodon purpureus]